MTYINVDTKERKKNDNRKKLNACRNDSDAEDHFKYNESREYQV